MKENVKSSLNDDISRVLLQRQKRIVNYYVKKVVKEYQYSNENKHTLRFQRIGILIHVLS